LNQRSFQSLYNQLLDVSTSTSAIFLIKENAQQVLGYFKHELDLETSSKDKKQLVEIYNEIIGDQYPTLLNHYVEIDYIQTHQLLAHFTSYLLDYKSYESQVILDKFIQKLILKLDKKTLDSRVSKAIIDELNLKIAQSFIIDNTYVYHYNYNEASLSMNISQYTLGIIYLIIAEKLNLPIYGIPFEDKLVLCYVESYCSHNELVFEEDILYYIIIGEKDIVYTPQDLFLYAYLLEQDIDLKNRMPHSNQDIILKWAAHIVNSDFDLRTRHNLSSKYQQILSPISEIEDL
jgi:hypothetical protein